VDFDKVGPMVDTVRSCRKDIRPTACPSPRGQSTKLTELLCCNWCTVRHGVENQES